MKYDKHMVDEVAFIHKTNPRSRNLRLRIDSQGQVIVTTPRFTPGFLVRRFVNQHLDWIREHQQQAQRAKASHNPKTVVVFGKQYEIELTSDDETPLGISINDNKLLFKPVVQLTKRVTVGKTEPPSLTDGLLPEGEYHKPFRAALNRFLKNTASHYLIPRTQQLAQKMGVTVGNITLREQKTRWGSCSSRGNLNFNWRLVHCDPAIIDYVIIHELAHRTEMNHSASFWRIVAEHDPEYSKHRGWLKRQGMNLG
jgi:predicted metal-dependent hydrolase